MLEACPVKVHGAVVHVKCTLENQWINVGSPCGTPGWVETWLKAKPGLRCQIGKTEAVIVELKEFRMILTNIKGLPEGHERHGGSLQVATGQRAIKVKGQGLAGCGTKDAE